MIVTRKATVDRKTKETQVQVTADMDGKGTASIDTTYEFFDHMLDLFSRHARVDLKVKATGDLSHHVIEDVGLVLGKALRKALGDKRGIQRFGWAYAPMDETLARAVVDLSGRPYAKTTLQLAGARVEDTPLEMIAHFLYSMAMELRANLHVEVLYGDNDHHKVEGAIKALALAFRAAKEVVGKEIPSTKGLL